MKKILLLLFLLAAVAAGLIYAYKEMSAERQAEMKGEAPVIAESRVKRAADGSVSLTLDAETQKRIALQTTAPAAAKLQREVKAYGRVLDPAPLAAQLTDLVSTRTALEASKKELARLKQLYEQGQNTSLRAVEAAEAIVRRDEIAHDGARMKGMSGWGKMFMPGPGLPLLLEPLVARENALVRLDLPAGETTTTPQTARLVSLTDPDQPVTSEFLCPAADVDAQAQGRGFLFLAKGSQGRLAPGQALIGFIQQQGEALNGVVVPASAVIRAAGKGWVYLQTADTVFARREIALDHPTAGGWLVTSGVRAGDRLVVTGAQTLFSEELKSRIQVGE